MPGPTLFIRGAGRWWQKIALSPEVRCLIVKVPKTRIEVQKNTQCCGVEIFRISYFLKFCENDEERIV